MRSRTLFVYGGVTLALGMSVLGCGSSGGESGGSGGAGAGTAAPGSGGAVGTGGSEPDGTGGIAATGTGGSAAGTGGTVGSGGAIAVTGGRGGQTSGGSGGNPGTGGRVAGSGGAAGSTTTGAGGASASSNITVWLAGDSTMAAGPTPCPVGWGTQFMPLFNSHVTVVNSAAGGTSLHTWLYSVLTTKDPNGECSLAKDAAGNPTLQPRWQNMLTGMKAGDYLFIEFGINDGGGGMMTCPRYESPAQFEKTYEMMAQAAKDRGAQPILLTSTSFMQCTGATVTPNRGFGPETKAAAAAEGVPVIDLTQLSANLYTSLGLCPNSLDFTSTTSAVGKFFCDDHTHFESAGAAQIAGVVAKALRDQNIGLAAYLK